MRHKSALGKLGTIPIMPFLVLGLRESKVGGGKAASFLPLLIVLVPLQCHNPPLILPLLLPHVAVVLDPLDQSTLVEPERLACVKDSIVRALLVHVFSFKEFDRTLCVYAWDTPVPEILSVLQGAFVVDNSLPL